MKLFRTIFILAILVCGASIPRAEAQVGLVSLGAQVVPFGASTSGPEFSPWDGQQFPTNANWTYLASQGVTLARLPFAWESMQPTLLGALDPTYSASLLASIAAANAVGIQVVPELHNFGFYCSHSHWISNLGNCGYAGNAGATGTGVNFLGDGTLTLADLNDVSSRMATLLHGVAGVAGYGVTNEPSPTISDDNLLVAPNGFPDSIGAQPWFPTSSAVATALAEVNPISSSYGPPWQITSGSGGFGSFEQVPTLGSGTYALSCDLRKDPNFSTTAAYLKIGATQTNYVATSTWTRVSMTAAPGAGATTIAVGVNVGAGNAVDWANCDIRAGSTPATDLTYEPNPWLPYAQGAITAFRSVDSVIPIFVNGYAAGTAYTWPWINWELASLTGGPLVMEAHQYPDGPVSQGGDGGIFSGVYSSYSGLTSTSFSQMLQPFINWTISTGTKGYIGEFAVPSHAACTSCTIAGSVLTVAGTSGGQWDVGYQVQGSSVTANSVITSLGSGTGDNGTYNLSQSSTVSSGEAMTGTITTASPWIALMNNGLSTLWQNRLTASMWFFNSGTLQPTNSLGVAPTTNPGSADDVRLTQMINTVSPFRWRGSTQAMSVNVQGLNGGTNWSRMNRSRHYSNVRFNCFRVVLQTFYPHGSPIADTNFVANYNFQVGFEYPYTLANTGIASRVPVTFNGATSVSYTAAGGPFGYIESDPICPGYWVPAGAFYGLWTTIENAAGSGTNTLPYQRNASNFLPKFIGEVDAASSQISTNAAITASSITATGTSAGGISNYFTPVMMLLQTDSTAPTVGVIGDSIAYGVGEGTAGNAAVGDPMGSALENAGYVSRGVFEGLGLNAVNLGVASDSNLFVSTAANWKYRSQLLTLANPTMVINENGHNDNLGTLAVNWVANTVYPKYTVVAGFGSVNTYMAIQGGTSAASGGPTGTGSSIADNTVVWSYITSYSAVNDRASYMLGLIANVNSQIAAATGGAPVTQAAITPQSTSTDSWATSGNQTASNFFGVASPGSVLNGFITGLNPLLGARHFIDPNADLEFNYPTNTSLWVVNGTANYATFDGTHPDSQGAFLGQAAVVPSILQ